MVESQRGVMVINDAQVVEKRELFVLFLKFLYVDKEAFKSVGQFSFADAVFLLELADFYHLFNSRFK